MQFQSKARISGQGTARLKTMGYIFVGEKSYFTKLQIIQLV